MAYTNGILTTMSIVLRDYQIKVKKEIYEAWGRGAHNVLVQLSTGAGKTVVFSNIIAEEKEYSIAIAHRTQIVGQISLTLARHGIRHNVIAQRETIRNIVAIHMQELKRSYYDSNARCTVAGVDTLIRMNEPWFKKVKLVVQDEAHHVLKDNKWGAAAALFPNALGLYPTATPERADGRGLGRHADGIVDVMVEGPNMRELINRGYLTDYKIIGSQHHINLSDVPLSASGDFSPPKLRAAMHRAQITGDIVGHYLKFAEGKLGVTFAVSVEAATEIAAEFRAAGVPAEVITSKTPELLRHNIMRQFRNREILQLVNVDLLGEGVDVPAIEVVSLARPTQSYAVYAQQLGRALRPMPGKTLALVIDHVDNHKRHIPPDHVARTWSLDRRERSSRGLPADVIPLRTCLNSDCLAAYERIHRACPFCGHHTPPAQRSAPEFVDGDLTELSPEALAALRGEIARVDRPPPQVATALGPIVQRAVVNRHYETQRAQLELRKQIALWAGDMRDQGKEDPEIYRHFYFAFGTDILSAQALRTKDAEVLTERIQTKLAIRGVVEA